MSIVISEELFSLKIVLNYETRILSMLSEIYNNTLLEIYSNTMLFNLFLFNTLPTQSSYIVSRYATSLSVT